MYTVSACCIKSLPQTERMHALTFYVSVSISRSVCIFWFLEVDFVYSLQYSLIHICAKEDEPFCTISVKCQVRGVGLVLDLFKCSTTQDLPLVTLLTINVNLFHA